MVRISKPLLVTIALLTLIITSLVLAGCSLDSDEIKNESVNEMKRQVTEPTDKNDDKEKDVILGDENNNTFFNW
ncbi:MAG: hypothetical protein ACQESE_04575 [Nanobdellota archaeon]